VASLRTSNILTVVQTLRGNTRVAVLLEPMWGIPFVLCNFYLSLYMKSLGVTDQEIGYLIALGLLCGSATAFAGGLLVDRLGRKKSTLIFDLLAWPVSLGLYALAGGFWGFAIGMAANSFVRIATVGWNLMVIEDADNEQRIAAFNFLNVVTVSTGILTPLAGLLVRYLGIVPAERVLLIFAVISITTQILIRNHLFTETRIGERILKERREKPDGRSAPLASYRDAFAALRNSRLRRVMSLVILYMLFMPVASLSSLYFAPYLTESLGLATAAISLLGGLYSAVLMVMFVIVVPLISRGNRLSHMLTGLVLQVAALVAFIVIPPGSFALAGLAVVAYAVGFALFKPFMDSALAEATEGHSRVGIYALNNTLISLFGAAAAFFSGHLFHLLPSAVWMLGIGILLGCAGILVSFRRTGFAPAGDLRPLPDRRAPLYNASIPIVGDDGTSRSPAGNERGGARV